MDNTAEQFEENLFVDVWLPLSIPGSYTYRLKREDKGKVVPGMRVLVSFGKKKLYAALVVRLHHNPPDRYEAKYILERLDEIPLVHKHHLSFWEWMARYYIATPGEVMRMALPSGFKIESDTRYTLRDEEEMSPDSNDVYEQEFIQLFKLKKEVSFKDLESHPSYSYLLPLFRKGLKSGRIVSREEWQERYRPKVASFIRLASEPDLMNVLPRIEKKSFRQAECILYLLKEIKAGNTYEEGWMEKSKLLEQFDASVVRALLKKNIFEEIQAPVSRLLDKETPETDSGPELSDAQQRAFERVNNAFSENRPVLLHGVTGSGKTEIFIRLIQDTLKEGNQVLYLLPEIALTIHHIRRLKRYFGNRVGIYHSRFNSHERVEIWQKVLENNRNASEGYQIVLAPRSGIFLPFERLGLIVVDEEHDASYKQQQMSPRYHARDVALYLTKSIYKNCRIILGSATPSAESMYHTRYSGWVKVDLKEKYHRVQDAPMLIADMNREYSGTPEPVIIGSLLREKTLEVLHSGMQVLMFMGRRGYAPFLRCRICGHVKMCLHCDVPMVYHKNPGYLLCHYCGYTCDVAGSCDRCGSRDMAMWGTGTEKIEEWVADAFPGYRVERMDLDNVRTRQAFSDILERFEQKKIDILVGKHLITKGLDFENIGLVAILNYDRHLHFPDFRSFERAYQLARQLQGRVSRKKQYGYFIIQTHEPEHPLLEFLKNGNDDSFYDYLLQHRKNHNYPPFYKAIEADCVATDKQIVLNASASLKSSLERNLPDTLRNQIELLGPEWPALSRLKGKYHRRIFIKYSRAASPSEVYSWLENALDNFYREAKHKNFLLHWNVDP